MEIIQILTRRRKVWSTWKTKGVEMGFQSQAVEVKRKKKLKMSPSFFYVVVFPQILISAK